MTLAVDVLNIPEAMGTYALIVWNLSFVLLSFTFVSAIVTEQAKTVQGEKGEKPEYGSVIYMALLMLFSLLIYNLIFRKIVAFCEGMGYAILNYEDWFGFMAILNQRYKQVTALNLFSISLTDVILGMSLILASIIESVFDLIRYIFLSVLYIIGPVTFALAVYKPTRMLVKGWLLSTFQVSFWIVVLRIFQTAILSFQVHQFIQTEDPVNTTFITVVVTFVLLLTMILAPAFTSKIFSGQNVGMLGTAFITGVSFLISRSAMRTAFTSTINTVKAPFSAAATIPRRIFSTLRGSGERQAEEPPKKQPRMR